MTNTTTTIPTMASIAKAKGTAEIEALGTRLQTADAALQTRTFTDTLSVMRAYGSLAVRHLMVAKPDTAKVTFAAIVEACDLKADGATWFGRSKASLSRDFDADTYAMPDAVSAWVTERTDAGESATNAAKCVADLKAKANPGTVGNRAAGAANLPPTTPIVVTNDAKAKAVTALASAAPDAIVSVPVVGADGVVSDEALPVARSVIGGWTERQMQAMVTAITAERKVRYDAAKAAKVKADAAAKAKAKADESKADESKADESAKAKAKADESKAKAKAAKVKAKAKAAKVKADAAAKAKAKADESKADESTAVDLSKLSKADLIALLSKVNA